MAALSIKRQLAARVAEAAGVGREKADLILRGFYEELLRATNESDGAGLQLPIAKVGRVQMRPSRRGSRFPKTGQDLGPHWAFWFKPYQALVKRTAEVCAARRGS